MPAATRGAGKHTAAISKSSAAGLPYLVKDSVAALPDDRFIERLDIVRQQPTPEVSSAIMGAVPKPGLMLSAIVDEYAKLNAASLKAKSPNQLKKWRVSRDSSLKTFLDVIGRDVEVAGVTRSHVLALRNHWNDLAARGDIQIESANKYLGRLSAIFKAVAEAHQVACGNIFEKIYIKGGKKGKRHSFDTGWVQDVLLADGAFDDLNAEARAIVYLIVETGVRLVEACNLDKATIVLDHSIPHIRIRPNGRQLKTEQSARDIPLVGVALMAMKAHPEGFPRYSDKNPQASAVINGYLRNNFVRSANSASRRFSQIAAVEIIYGVRQSASLGVAGLSFPSDGGRSGLARALGNRCGGSPASVQISLLVRHFERHVMRHFDVARELVDELRIERGRAPM